MTYDPSTSEAQEKEQNLCAIAKSLFRMGATPDDLIGQLQLAYDEMGD